MLLELINDTEAERRVISSILHSEVACIYALDKLNDTDFYNPVNRDVFLLTQSIYSSGVKPTLVEVLKEGTTTGYLHHPEQIQDLKQIATHYIDAENIKYWTNKVKDASKARKLQQSLKKYTSEIKKPKTDINELIKRVNDDVFTLSMDLASEVIETPQSLAKFGAELINARVDKYRAEQERRRLEGITGDALVLEGTPTGLPTLDKISFGYKPGDLIILGAQTGHGKTAFALNTAKAICLDSKKPLLYINTEMSRAQLAYRWGGMLSGLPIHRLRAGSLTNVERDHAINSYTDLARSGFYPATMPNLTNTKLKMLAQSAKMQFGIEILVLDYVGRMDKFDDNLKEWQMLEQIIKTQKILAQNLDIACLVLVQLNEDGSLQGAKRMKNESDMLLKLVPVEKPEEIEKIEEKNRCKYEPFNYRLYIDKARDSESGVTIPLMFEKEIHRIKEANVLKTGWEGYGKEI